MCCQILTADSETCDEWTAHLQRRHDAAQKFSDASMTKVVATPAALCLSSFIVGPPAMTPRENNSDQKTERYRIGLFRKFPHRDRLLSVELADEIIVGEALL
jgi:hypothetical protein